MDGCVWRGVGGSGGRGACGVRVDHLELFHGRRPSYPSGLFFLRKIWALNYLTDCTVREVIQVPPKWPTKRSTSKSVALRSLRLLTELCVPQLQYGRALRAGHVERSRSQPATEGLQTTQVIRYAATAEGNCGWCSSAPGAHPQCNANSLKWQCARGSLNFTSSGGLLPLLPHDFPGGRPGGLVRAKSEINKTHAMLYVPVVHSGQLQVLM